jgi:uncharacterized protein YdaU (DUF1376 family)
MNQPPAFQFYADDFIAGVADMTQCEVGAYIMLLAHGWNTRGLDSSDPDRLKLLAKGDVSKHVLGKFKLKNGRLLNNRQERERKKQREYRDKQAINGAKGGRPISKPKPNPSLSFGLTQTEPKKSSPSPLPSPSPKEDKKEGASRFTPPDLPTIKLQAAKIGLSDIEAEKFFNHYTANGWRVGKNPMRSWTHSISNWKLNAQNYGNGKSNSTNSRPNPRNIGIIRGPTDYATARPRLQVEREEAERKRLDGQVVADENNPSPTQSSAVGPV